MFRGVGSSALRDEWNETDLPMLIAALHYLILGHFALGPILGDVFGGDPLAAADPARQAAFLRRILRLLAFGKNLEAPSAS